MTGMTVGPSFGCCHPTPGAGARRQVWLAVGTSKRGRGRENDARVKKLCRFLGFGLLTVTAEGRVDVVAEPAPWKPRRDAKRRSRIEALTESLSEISSLKHQ